MDIKVISYTVDSISDSNSNGHDINDFLTLGGREAGICYMSDNYLSEKIQNTEAALKRANMIIGTGHHSPFDHAYIGIEISGLPKILAMILNSTEFYTTSEKSARYTVMNPETQLELDIYNKWQGIFNKEIHKLNINATEKEIEKLALENARYMISVFTPTTMGYTTSFRQYSYLGQWLEKFIEELKLRPNNFNDRLIKPCQEFANFCKNLTNNSIIDHKDGNLQFMVSQLGDEITNKDIFSDIYQTTYLGSFAQLAQAQRHRTIHYEMQFSGEKPGEFGCYVPKIIRNTDLEKEWINDFNTIADKFPQCTMVKILEQGRAYWFFMKCKERLCGRAQLEICEQTAETMLKFIENKSALSKRMQNMLDAYTKDGEVVPKCGMTGYKCKESCRWGTKSGINRMI